ncbi:hypothetical protein SEVIR_8G201800v4 [Setaria viridis]|uniref:phosphatidate phosphatase n=1 Tax=Setaria viridis TaxID=4556 RepID=A0A4U6THI2_SETVI|nr:phosphatidate phosphatase PAH2-like [Setaria viridis]XP_034606965.1 phosphatidate phosphatase PAH2-like [Setaria viridis]TKW01790.1 hypothetical protein SEVIR_8G201800v2 [Setaria viridis]
MYAVGKVGSLISRSVYTVSGPFHPFGGAVDIVVVQQQDGSFKSSPWYVRFGKFQGVLKSREKVVNISVNGVEAGFHMYLDSNGEAYFLRNADPNGEEGEFVVSPASSGDEREAPIQEAQLRKSKSTSCDSSTMEADVGEGKMLARTTSRRTTILERMFGRKTVKNNAHAVDRVSSLERAEIAAELLDTKWSTNLPRSSKSHGSNDESSKSKLAEASSSNQMETSKTLLPEHSLDHGKETNSNCNSCSPRGGTNSSADETDQCLQTISVKEEVVEIHTRETSDFTDRIISTVHQPGSESLSNDLGTDKSIHESVDTQDKLPHNLEDVAGREIHKKEAFSNGIFEIHTVETDTTSGKSEVVSQFVTVDSYGANQNLTGANSPAYATTDEKHEVTLIPSAQDPVQEKVVILSSSETVEISQDAVQEKMVIFSSSETLESSYAVSNISDDKVCDASDTSLADSIQREEHSGVSDGSQEQVFSEERLSACSGASSNKKDVIEVVVEEHGAFILEDPAPQTLQGNGPDMDISVDSVSLSHTDAVHDFACQHDVVCPDASSSVVETSSYVPDYDPEDVTNNVIVENQACNRELDVSVTQTSIIGDESTECNAQSANFPNKIEVESSPTATGSSSLVNDPEDVAKSLIEENKACNREPCVSVTLTSTIGDEPTECIAQSANFPNKMEIEGSQTVTGSSSLVNDPEDVTENLIVENKACNREPDVSVTLTSTIGDGSTEFIAQSANFPNKIEVEEGSPTATGSSNLVYGEVQSIKTEGETGRSSSVSGDEVGFVLEATAEPEEEAEARVSFSEYTEEIQFQFSDTENFADRKAMDDIVADKTAGEGEHEESDCDTEKQEEGDLDLANVLENCSDSLRPVTSPVSIPTCNLQSEDNTMEAKSLPNLRSHIHDLERSDSFQLSRSLQPNAENNGVDPVKSTDSSFLEQKSEVTGDSEENSSPPEVTSNVVPDDKHADNLKIDPFVPFAELSLCRHLLSEGMGEDAARSAFDSEKVTLEKFHTMKQSLMRNNKLVVRIAGRYFPWDAAAPIVLGLISFSEEQVFEPKGMIKVEQIETSAAPGGSWRIWPFSFRRTRTISAVQPVCESTVETSISTPVKESTPFSESDRERNKSRAKRIERKVRSLTPTSEELASLDLREGRNVVTFTFSTAIVGKQQVDCHIYLWKWNTRIVISDVDGTITKSDVLGQFMPLVGVDWSQNGVAHLFSAIKENGYQLLFLSARAISQAHITRQFLFNLKQDGKALPDGPVVISPDGLFPSLYREVIRRAPHEFKISCLEAIKDLFPPDSNPFYAGFGNRDTDELSYLKVGIPMGKIFIINPKGEVAVNRRVDTKSYTSLHALVHGMFPPISSSSEQEDYNTWNYWKMPLPDVDL